MLTHLHIKDYALIDALDIDFGEGFAVITGETGAGKSVLLGAIGLLLGDRADAKAIKAGARQCTIEAQFDLSRVEMQAFFDAEDIDFDGTHCTITRIVTAAGKSRAFVNDTPVTATLLRQLGEGLVDIHSQHKNLLLQTSDFQLSLLDTLASNKAEREVYATAYDNHRRLRRELDEAVDAAKAGSEERDFLSFQVERLAEAHLKRGEAEELEEELKTLEHAEDIKTGLQRAMQCMESDEGGAVDLVRSALNELRAVSRLTTRADELQQRTDSLLIELRDIASEVESLDDDIQVDPERRAEVEERLDLLYTLQQKHHTDTVDDLIDLLDELQAKLDAIEGGDERVAELRAKLKEAEAQLAKAAATLTATRTKAAPAIVAELQSRLEPLGMKRAVVKLEITPLPNPTQSGTDCVRFVIDANGTGRFAGLETLSGGEAARVMLALKVLLTGAVKLPTIIFDEIDTGTSGRLAEAMAHMMHEMAQGGKGRQVIAISHLPQIAAVGDSQYRVVKELGAEGTTSRLERLSDDERVEEIARMLSGEQLTPAAIANAKALLQNSK